MIEGYSKYKQERQRHPGYKPEVDMVTIQGNLN